METNQPLKKPMQFSSVVMVKILSHYVIVYLGHGLEKLLFHQCKNGSWCLSESNLWEKNSNVCT